MSSARCTLRVGRDPAEHLRPGCARAAIPLRPRAAPRPAAAAMDGGDPSALDAGFSSMGLGGSSGDLYSASFTSADEDAAAPPARGGAAPPAPPPGRAAEPALVVFSGGTAFNGAAGPLGALTTRVAHVLPVSDDGGSTAEIVRVLGGPAVGDIRSRCLRLADARGAEAAAVAALLAHRLPGGSADDAKAEWYAIVEGDHALWDGVSEPYKHTIRAFLVHFHAQILRHASERFDFRAGSVGNFFFAGARVFFRSLEAAIFLFSRVARIPEGSLVLPAVLTEERLALAAELEDGSLVRGQNAISHPGGCPASPGAPRGVDKAAPPGPPLPAPVRRVFYVGAEGALAGDRREHEVAPPPNPRVLAALARADAVVYGMGSLYTSIAPSLVLRGVGEAVAAAACPKILVINGSVDRETSAARARPGEPMAAPDVVAAVADALNRRHSARAGTLAHAAADYVTAVLVPRGGPVVVDAPGLRALGVRRVVEVDARPAPGGGGAVVYDAAALVAAIGGVVAAHAGGGGGGAAGGGGGA